MMSIGLGIILAAIIVSLTVLYINRRTDIELPVVGIKQPKLATIKKFLLVGATLILASFATYVLFVRIANMPKKQYSYQGIKLGMSMKDVQYIKGRPKSAVKEKAPIKDGYYVVPDFSFNENSTVFDFPKWYFGNDEGSVSIDFDKPNGKVVAIECNIPPYWSQYSGPHTGCEPLSGITDGMLEEDVKERLGTPDEEQINLIKQLTFKKFNAKFYLEKQRVFYKVLKDPEWVEGSNLTIKN